MNRTVSRFVLPAALGASLLAAVASAQQPAPREPEEEYGEWLARPTELATVPIDRIPRSLRLNGQAMLLGQKVFAQHCAGCHGADLKGLPEQHTPDLTDGEWRFGGDDLASGGETKYPSDVEWTVRYGVRTGDPYARGAEVSMLAFDPQYRTKEDTEDFGGGWFINLEEIDDVVEYVLEISGRPFDKAKAARGDVLPVVLVSGHVGVADPGLAQVLELVVPADRGERDPVVDLADLVQRAGRVRRNEQDAALVLQHHSAAAARDALARVIRLVLHRLLGRYVERHGHCWRFPYWWRVRMLADFPAGRRAGWPAGGSTGR